MSKRESSWGWKSVAATALLMLCGHAAMGQAPDGPPPGPPPDDAPHGRMERGGGNPQRELGMLTKVLSLTADQQKGVLSVLEQQAAEMKALREKAPMDPSTGQTPESREARRAQMNQIREESSTKIAALLDENQKKTFAAWEEKRKAAMERRQREDGPPPPPPPNE